MIERKRIAPSYAKRTQDHSYRLRGKGRTYTHFNARTPIAPARTTTYPTIPLKEA